MDYAVHEILQTEILGKLAFPSRRSSQPSQARSLACSEFFAQLSHLRRASVLSEYLSLLNSLVNQARVSCIASSAANDYESPLSIET